MGGIGTSGNRRRRRAGTVPGTLYQNGSRWWWAVRLPGREDRLWLPLIPGGRLVWPDEQKAAPGPIDSGQRTIDNCPLSTVHTGKVSVAPPDGGTKAAALDRGVAEAVAGELWDQAIRHAAETPGGNATSGLTLSLLVERYLAHAREYYRTADGVATREADNLADAVRPLADRWPLLPAAEFEVSHLIEYRNWLVAGRWPEDPAPGAPGRKPVARSTANKRIDGVRRMFRWAAGEAQLVPARIWQQLMVIKPLAAHRSAARETAPVRPVADWAVAATLEYTTSTVAAMVRLQRITSMRSAEICQMTPANIDRGGEIWIYSCRQWKGRHRQAEDKPKIIALGPKAQKILLPLLKRRGPGTPIFSPAESQAERLTALRADRRSKVPPSQEDRRRQEPDLSFPSLQKTPGDSYNPRSYAQAVRYAIAAVNKARQAARQKPLILVPHWHPHQLRHSAATEITESADLAAAALALGHETVRMTEHYAREAVERIRLAQAIDVARRLG